MAQPPSRTVRFVDSTLQALDHDRCQAIVRIERPESGIHTATAEGGPMADDGLRTVSRATADAVCEGYADEGVKVRVRGIQSVDAFGQVVVIVSVAASVGGRNQALLGICQSEESSPRAAALAVLNATNRFLGSV